MGGSQRGSVGQNGLVDDQSEPMEAVIGATSWTPVTELSLLFRLSLLVVGVWSLDQFVIGSVSPSPCFSFPSPNSPPIPFLFWIVSEFVLLPLSPSWY